MIQFESPLVFEPILRPQVWGDRRLETMLGKALPDAVSYGESWELSPLPQKASRVAAGPQTGRSINELWSTGLREQADVAAGRGFPWLIKWLDIHDWLSVQVHPNEAQAMKWLNEPCAKSEAWVVVHAERAARVYAGFQPGVTEADVRRAVDRGSLIDCLHSFVPKTGDCINIPAGTVHAAGGGLVIAEVQQPSDATFRLFDWNRVGSDGKPRTLHLIEGLDCIKWPQGPVTPETPRPLLLVDGRVAAERMLSTPHFVFDRFLLVDDWSDSAEQLSVWMVLSGDVVLEWSDGHRALCRGDSALVPPRVSALKWRPQRDGATLLRVRLPGDWAA